METSHLAVQVLVQATVNHYSPLLPETGGPEQLLKNDEAPISSSDQVLLGSGMGQAFPPLPRGNVWPAIAL